MILSSRVMTFVGLASLGSQDHSHEPYPVVVWLYASPVGPYLYGGLSYLSSPPSSVVFSTRHGIEMVFVQTKGIVVPLVLVVCVMCACLGQSRRIWWSSTLLHPSQGSGWRRGCAELGSVW